MTMHICLTVTRAAALAGAVCMGAPAPWARMPGSDIGDLRDQIEMEREKIEIQRQALEGSLERLDALEARLLNSQRGRGPQGPETAQLADTGPSAQPKDVQPPVQPVGEAPEEDDRPPQVTVIADEGGVVTRKGQFTLEPAVEYTHLSRSRFAFRGIELIPSILVGVFDINDSEQNIVTSSLAARYGISSRFEVNARAPFVYRRDRASSIPVSDATQNEQNRLQFQAGDRAALGDAEFALRYQLNRGRGGWPFLIANIQGVAPTGKDPYSLERDAAGTPTQAATGAGFWAVGGSVTAILPSDPAVLFGTVGYTRNFSRTVNSEISELLRIGRVEPGDQVSASLGVGLTLNPRLSINLGYAHSWAFSTRSESQFRPFDVLPANDADAQAQYPNLMPGDEVPFTSQFVDTDDLHIGRFLFGMSLRISDRTTINWNVEIGATEAAPDVRTSIRVPINFGG
ncbi:MAG: hypothetical protein ACFBZ9_03865 [Sphingomonadales bacterium]